MKRLIDVSCDDARNHFLKGSSYFNADLPSYISFEPILRAVATILEGGSYLQHKATNPSDQPDVNYSLIANKDGRLAWRPHELMHPVLYVSLVNLMCDSQNWRSPVCVNESETTGRMILLTCWRSGSPGPAG
jgi:RNA-directed DNA polymerase